MALALPRMADDRLLLQAFQLRGPRMAPALPRMADSR
jgi:hypothetical protein